MKETSDLTCLVVDHGLFLPVAQRLAQFYGRVLYHKPGTEAFPTLQRGCVGDGFENVECCHDMWPLVDAGEVDLAVFPDILDSGTQLHLERLGVPVWGSRRGDSIELEREKFLAILRNHGMAVPEFERVVGVTALRKLLRVRDDQYVKISRWRGSMKTWHWRSWDEDENKLDQLAVGFGACRERVPFLVFEPVVTDIEDGGDFYCVDGRWPATCVRGIECKDKGYLGAVTKVVDLPDYLREILDVFGPELARYRYRNLFSVEVRVTDDAAYFIDPCCRGPIPATGSQMMLYDNMGEIVWQGANGVLVEPECSKRFSVECVTTMKVEPKVWRTVVVPPELRNWWKLPCCCEVDGVVGIPPDEQHGEEVGWLVATGDSPADAIETLKGYAEMLPDGVTARMEAIVELVREAEAMEDADVPLTDAPVPEPAEVVDEPA